MNRIFSGIMLTLLLTIMLPSTFIIKPVKATGGTIYIRADGSIDPPSAPISTVDKVTYTFTGSITIDPNLHGIVVERSNIIIDGAGCMLQGPGSMRAQSGIVLDNYEGGVEGVSNVTIKDLRVSGWQAGLDFWSSSHNTVMGNEITDSYIGVLYMNSEIANYARICGNNITNNDVGIWLAGSSNVLEENDITNNHYGIILYGGSSNKLSDNDVIGNRYGIYLDSYTVVYSVDINNDNAADAGFPDLGYPNPVYPNPCGYTSFRHALWHTMDREYVIANMWGGNGDPMYTPMPSSFPEYVHSEIVPGGSLGDLVHPYDLAEAGGILDAAGFVDTDGDGWRNFPESLGGNGENIMLKYYIRVDDAPRLNMGLWHAAQIEAIGVKVEKFLEDEETCFEEVMTNKDYHLYTGAIGWWWNPLTWLYFCHSRYYGHPGWGPQNYNRVNCSSYDYWVDAAIDSNTFEEARNAAAKAQEAFNGLDCVGVIFVLRQQTDYGVSDTLVARNNITNNSWFGVYLLESSQNKFCHNFINNPRQVSIFGSSNVWDDGYPSGGNYWSDYTEKYPGAEGLDGSGIWDTPYVIDANNHDNYPLINPWVTPLDKFEIGDWVQTTANLNVREGPGLGYAIISTMPLGTIGQILGGPVEADGYIWWDIDYALGVRGWSAQNWLELAPPNQPPVAVFDYYPVEPKAGEQVTFNASASCDPDPDGAIVFYEWDWNGDGDYDDYTISPTITFWWWEDDIYNVKLKVIDDKGAVNSTSKEITVSKSPTSETNIVLASIWDRFRFGWDTGLALNEIDRYMGLDWLKPYNKADLASILNEEVDSTQAPGLNYKTFARSKIFEEKLINKAFRFYISVSHEVSKYVFRYVLDSVWKLGVQITLDGVMMLNPLVGAGLKTIYLGVQMHSLSEAFKRINKYWYMLGLAEYWFWRPDSSQDTAWSQSVSKWVNKAITTHQVPLTEGQKEKTLEETKFYFEALWKEYGDKGDFGVGLHKNFQQENRNKLKNLLLSALKDKYGGELLSRKIVHVASPVELRVYDSEGRITGVINGEEKAEIPNSVYNSETKTATVFLPSDSLKYEVAGTSAGTYELEITSIENGQIINFTATDIPTSSYAIHQCTVDWGALSLGEEGVTVMVDSDGDGVFEDTFTSDGELTHDEFMLQTATTIDFDPNTLNLKSKGKWVTVYIELPEGYDVADINVSSILLNSTIPVDPYAPWAIGDYDEDGIPDLMVKFDRAEATSYILANVNITQLIEERFMTITLTITGYLDDGTPFDGSDTVRIMMPGAKGAGKHALRK